ncbi:MAG: 50S ribosomal protein L9 [Patescibacteria group bacterium]|jgi:large subunit ribosomal protein L9
MKVLFLTAIPPYKAGEIYNISDGYARNFLIPKGYVLPADDKTLSHVKELKAINQKRISEQSEKLKEALGKLNGLDIHIQAKITPAGKLYAKISPAEISKAIFENIGENLSKSLVDQLPYIKDSGQHEITLQENDKTIKFTLII